MKDTAEDAFQDSVKNYYTADEEDQMVNQKGVDAVQCALECCGYTGQSLLSVKPLLTIGSVTRLRDLPV